MKIIDGKKISKAILDGVKKEVESLSFTPIFCDVLVGEDPVSKQYVNLKARMAERVGMSFYDASYETDISTEKLVAEIQELNNLKNMCGIIVQLPLPAHIDTKVVLNSISPKLDVDCLGEQSNQSFKAGQSVLIPPTAAACLELLHSTQINLKEKNIVVLGNGELVGKPMVALLRQKDFDPIVLDIQSIDKEAILKKADVIISGIGQGSFIKGEMIQENAIIIDAGTSESSSGIVGDVDFESVKDVAGYASPVPGGVGPVTVAMLFRNVLEVAKSLDDTQDEQKINEQ